MGGGWPVAMHLADLMVDVMTQEQDVELKDPLQAPM